MMFTMENHILWTYLGIIYDECTHKESHAMPTLREESSQTNVILQYKLLAVILNAVCTVIQQS